MSELMLLKSTEIPDILTPTQCEMLRKWNGELRFLPNFKFRRFGKKHLKDALQRIEKQAKTVVNKSTNNTKTVVSSTDEKIEGRQKTEKNSIENKESSKTNLSENTKLNECSMDTSA